MQHFGFLDPNPPKYADPRIRFQGAKCQPKYVKINFAHLKTIIRTVQKNKNIKFSLSLNGSSSLSVKISKKIETYLKIIIENSKS